MPNAKVYKYDGQEKKMKFAGVRKRAASEINIFVDTSKLKDGPAIQNAIEAKCDFDKPKFRYCKT